MSIVDVRKSKRGRPAANSTAITVRLHPDQLKALDRWISAKGVSASRPEAIRRILDAGLKLDEFERWEAAGKL